jgi:hypothetical protein
MAASSEESHQEASGPLRRTSTRTFATVVDSPYNNNSAAQVSIGYSEAESSYFSNRWRPRHYLPKTHQVAHAEQFESSQQTNTQDEEPIKDQRDGSAPKADDWVGFNSNSFPNVGQAVSQRSMLHSYLHKPKFTGSLIMSDITSNMGTLDPCSTRHCILVQPRSLESRTLFTHTPTGQYW